MRNSSGAKVLSFLLLGMGAIALTGCPGEEDVSAGDGGAADGGAERAPHQPISDTKPAADGGVATGAGGGGGKISGGAGGAGGSAVITGGGSGGAGVVLPPPGTGGSPATGTGGAPGMPPVAKIQYVFVIAMENEAATAIYGSSSAPYINKELVPKYARANAFADPLADGIPSEPHYVWMEAGTNKFSDTTFTGDGDPSASNSTKNTAHLSTQMGAANPPVSWLSYQEGLSASTGACPIHSSGLYGAKHDPFIFFQDVSGSPPSATNAFCADHHRPYDAASFAQDLQQKKVAQYNFISPNVCNDMHGDSACPGSDDIASGDAWLRATLPPIIDFVNANAGVIFVVWDEPVGGSTLIPFLAIGPSVKPNYAGKVAYTHSSLTKTVEEIFGLPILPTVAAANDLSDLFVQ